MSVTKPFWIMRDYVKCSGCRRCEIACSLRHEGRIWPEASRVRVFMLFPGLKVPARANLRGATEARTPVRRQEAR